MTTKNIRTVLSAALAIAALAPVTAAAQRINLQSSEYRTFGTLPAEGRPTRIPWVGYWWAYSENGIASRYQGGESPAEKHDRALGRTEQVDLNALETHISSLRMTVHPLQEERRQIVDSLNRMIARNENYRDCSAHPMDGDCVTSDRTCSCPWNRYRELDELIRAAQRGLPEVNVDTATEFEHMNHGNGVPGVQGWWGHCNAWAAASILEPEPVRSATVEGITYSVGDVKALLTESYMDMNSAFYGTRVNDAEPSLDAAAARRLRELVGQGQTDSQVVQTVRREFTSVRDADVRQYLTWFRGWNDVTPADFHILFTVYLGKLHRAFVIDRYTGDQVWNQSVSGFRSRIVRELERTAEGRYPILVEATFEWASDGVQPDDTNGSVGSHGFHSRTVTYTLFLDKARMDPDARIVGPGVWEHAAAPGNNAHPDFIWVPLSDAPAARRQDGTYYENPFIDIAWIHEHLLPAVTGSDMPPPPPPGGETRTFMAAGLPAEIPDQNRVSVTFDVGADLTVGTAELELTIRHTYIGDLKITLEHDGVTQVLHDRTGGGTHDITRTIALDSFRTKQARGTWTLTVSDEAAVDTGRIEAATLRITP